MIYCKYMKFKILCQIFLRHTSQSGTRISPKEKSGANGKFLPKPLLFHLRHPNSKTNQSKFWQILSPKNSFRKAESALVPPPARILGGQNPKKKNVLSILEKITSAKIRKARNIFSFWGCRVKRGGGGAFVERTIQFRATTRSARGTSAILEIGASLVQ